MTPRLLTRTHYQVDEPAYLRMLVLRCTSPIRSEYRERVADRLVHEVQGIRRINVAAAGYGIDLGRATGLINENHVWTDRGHLLNLIKGPSESTISAELSLREQVFFFRLLLDSDGAAIQYFLRALRDRHQLPDDERDWNAIANDLFLWTFKSYYAYTNDLAARTRLRELIQQRQTKPFRGRSGEHKCFIHLQSLFRLGLVAKPGGDESRTYVAANKIPPTQSGYLLADRRGVEDLEDAIREQKWTAFASQLFSPSAARDAPQSDQANAQFYTDLFTAYRRLSETGVPVCPLRTLIEAVQIEQIVRGDPAKSYESCIEALKRLQREHPRQIQFHVDRLGRPAYLKLDLDLMRT
jgi:hypothetical protein